MKNSSTAFVGLDVHKNSIDIAIAELGRTGEVRHYGAIGGDLDALGKAVRKLRSRHADLPFAYEVRPCGYDKRAIEKKPKDIVWLGRFC